MAGRPTYLSLIASLNRLGAIAVLLKPSESLDALTGAIVQIEHAALICDPPNVDDALAAWAAKLGAGGPRPPVREVLVLGDVRRGRVLPAGAFDMETIDPDVITPPAWYRPDAGRARDLAMVFVTSGKYEPPRAVRITNRRRALAALGAAAAATLTTRDTVYCALPLHHPSGSLVAAHSALAGGARLALASRFEPATFWDEVRRYGVSVVFYAGEMCRRLVDADPVLGEKNNPVRLFAGSGMRPSPK
jgi:putative long chain acyl-CoA synthase